MTTHTRLDTRTARLKLKPQGKPYRTKIGDRLDLAYRRLKDAPGSWSLRRYDGKGYALEQFAVADDMGDADGVRTLTFHQAQARARELAKAQAAHELLKAAGPPIDVHRLVVEYGAERAERWVPLGGPKHDARSRLAKVLAADEKFAATLAADLTVDGLAAVRSRIGERTAHDLKAALNRGAKRYRDKLPPTLRDVIRDGLANPRGAPEAAREIQALSDSDVRRLVSAAQEIDREGQWDGSLFRMVLTLASTGSRFSQIARCVVADVQPRERRLMVPVSRKGNGVKQASRTAVPIGSDVIAALQSATAGRLGNESLFLRPDWRPEGVGRWVKGEPRPWRSPGEFGRPWQLIAQRAGLPGVTPYALRHSTIIRALSLGLPVQLVARLFDTSAQMIQQNYSASIVDALGELSERMVISLSPATVTPLVAAVR
jgi:integrase